MTHSLDRYGGTTKLKGERTGWFHLEDLGGRTWFVTPGGNAFFPVSLSHPYTGNSRETVRRLYGGDQAAWMDDWLGRTRALGFNCALGGATSNCRNSNGYVDVERAEALFRRESFPYAVGLFLIPHPNELPEGEERPDIFALAYRKWAEGMIADVCSRHADDPLVLGYYYGFGSFINPESWIAALPPTDGDADLQARIRHMAVSLYRMAHDAVRRHDPNHLILGPYVKEQSFDLETWQALAPWVDTLTPQHVNRDISFAEQRAATGRAVLVSDEVTGHLHDEAHRHAHAVRSSEAKGRIYALLLERHLRDPSVCGVNFCATVHDLDDGPLMDRWGMMEGLYDGDGNPKPGLVDAVAEANKRVYERAAEPYGADELVELDARFFRTWDEAHAGRH